VFDAEGTIEEYVAIQIDITDRKLRERQLAVLDRILRHNLRNDLSLVLGHAATIEEEAADEFQESAALIRETGESLLEKAEKERRVVNLITGNSHPRPIEIRSLIDRCVAEARSSSAAVTVDVDAPEEVTAVSLPALETAIAEILDNAVEHGFEKPHVRITVESAPDTVVIRIADDGPGIPEQERAILTDERDIDALYHGSGIGLWYVYWVVQLSGGRLAFEQQEPHGSVVVITLDRG
jgi:signal transduction histidine kinase